MNQAKLSVPGHSEPPQWEKIRKVANWQNSPFWVIWGHSDGKRSEKLRIEQNCLFRVIPCNFGGKRLEKLQIVQNWLFLFILSHFSGNRFQIHVHIYLHAYTCIYVCMYVCMYIYVMQLRSGEDPRLQDTLKNASYRGGWAAKDLIIPQPKVMAAHGLYGPATAKQINS